MLYVTPQFSVDCTLAEQRGVHSHETECPHGIYYHRIDCLQGTLGHVGGGAHGGQYTVGQNV